MAAALFFCLQTDTVPPVEVARNGEAEYGLYRKAAFLFDRYREGISVDETEKTRRIFIHERWKQLADEDKEVFRH